jgi:hypothetical protein
MNIEYETKKLFRMKQLVCEGKRGIYELKESESLGGRNSHFIYSILARV